ncbi:MAG: glycosyltransferase 2 family protein [Solirubrobacteraceae bacterium]|nr:glycosyltransferase 2 family protein [Solirubrobacteraceae bacterium]
MRAARSARPLLLVVALVVTVGAMALAVRGVALDDAADALAASDLLWLAPSFAVFAAGVALRGLRWWALFDARRRPPLREVTRALLVGYFFNNILPARAGEAARVISLHARTRTPRAETIGTVVAERVFDVLALLAILLAAYPWLPPISWLRAAAIFGVVVVAVVGALVFVLVRYDERAIHWLLSPLRRVRRDGFAARVEAAAVNATRGLVAIRDVRIALQSMVLTIASWVVLSLSYWILMQAFSLHLPFVSGLLVTITINMGLVLPSSPAALGVFEAATVIALKAFDVARADALSYALVLHLLNLVPFLAVGALLLGPAALRRRRRMDA